MTLMGIRVRLHMLTPLMLALAFALVGARALVPALVALGLHEGAHLLAALKLRARVDEIELMPFGAAIRLYELWSTSPRRLVVIALAGPLANILLSALLTLTLYAYPRLAPAAQPLIRMNLAIGLVNLLPALPLDGGRAVCALLARKMDRHKAVILGIWAGRALAGAILLFCLYLLLARGRLEVGLAFSAVYLFASGERERRQSEGASLRALLLARAQSPAPAQARLMVIGESASAYEAARAVEPGTMHIFAVVDENGNVLRLLTQAQIARAVEDNREAPLSALPGGA